MSKITEEQYLEVARIIGNAILVGLREMEKDNAAISDVAEPSVVINASGQVVKSGYFARKAAQRKYKVITVLEEAIASGDADKITKATLAHA